LKGRDREAQRVRRRVLRGRTGETRKHKAACIHKERERERERIAGGSIMCKIGLTVEKQLKMRPKKAGSMAWYWPCVRTSTCEGSTVMCGWLWYQPITRH
jgi:hypothetical protein